MTPGSDPTDLDPMPPSGTDSSALSSELIVRYLSDECTDAERAIVEAWRASPTIQPRDQAIFDLPSLLTTYVRLTTAPASPNDVLRRADAIMERDRRGRSSGRESETSTAPSEVRRRLWHRQLPVRAWPRAITLGAAAAFAMLLVFAGWQGGINSSRTRMAGQASSYTTAAGERTTIVLPDGSSVVLNVASRLDVPDDYGGKNRTLRLEGEALFTVASVSDVPFVVEAGSATTRVLGTRFAVRNYTTDTAVFVAVRDGKVAVGNTVLTANQQVAVSKNSMSPVTVARSGRFDFATGILTIDDMPLADATVELSRWYNADIRVGDSSINHLHLKGQFKAESLADLATMLEWSLGLRVMRDGRTLTLYPEL